MAKLDIINQFEALPKIAKIIILIFTFYLSCGIYRVLKYAENKNTNNLIFGILAFIPGVDIAAAVLDVYGEATENKITYFVE